MMTQERKPETPDRSPESRVDALTVAADPCCQALEDCLEADLFRALADPNRLVLLARRAALARPVTVSEVACCLPVDLSVVSRHLATLREAGIVRAEKRGREVYHALEYGGFVHSLRAIADAVERCCPETDGCGDACGCAPE